MTKSFDINNEIEAVIKEILDYKWLESEKEGHDIGIHRASREWIAKYYDAWFKSNLKRFMKEQ